MLMRCAVRPRWRLRVLLVLAALGWQILPWLHGKPPWTLALRWRLLDLALVKWGLKRLLKEQLCFESAQTGHQIRSRGLLLRYVRLSSRQRGPMAM